MALRLFSRHSSRSIFASSKVAVLMSIGTLLSSPALVFSASLTLQQALDKTAENNPELKRYPYYVRGLEAKKQKSGLTPAITAQASLENIAGSGPNKAVDNAELSLLFNRSIELGNKREKRVAVVDAELAKQLQIFEQNKLDVLAEAGHLFYRVAYQNNLVEWRQQLISQQRQSLAQVKRLAKAGAVAAADLFQMQLRLSQLQQALERDKADVRYSSQQLINMWQGTESAQTLTVLGSMDLLPGLPGDKALQEAINKAPALLVKQAEQRLAQASWVLSRAQKSSNLDVGVGVRRFESNSSNAFIFEVSAPLFQGRRSLPGIAMAKSEVDLKAFEQSQKRLQLLQGLTLLKMQMSQALVQLKILDGDIIPKAKLYLQRSEAAYKRGQYSLLQWLDAQQVFAQQERQRLVYQHRIYSLMLELERLAGQPLFHLSDTSSLLQSLDNNHE